MLRAMQDALQVHAAECAFIPHPRCPQALYHELGGERRVHGAQKGPVAGRPQRKGRGHATAGVRRLVEKASASHLKVSPTASSRRSADGRQSRSPTRRPRAGHHPTPRHSAPIERCLTTRAAGGGQAERGENTVKRVSAERERDH